MANISDFRYFVPHEDVKVTYGDLPHWEQPGASYFITFRTADSLPTQAVELWRSERDDWLNRRTSNFSKISWQRKVQLLSTADRTKFNRLFHHKLEELLDKGKGACPLAKPEIAQIVAKSLKHFDGDRYHLGDFVVMPNHVHVLVCVLPDVAMARVCYSWKHFTATQINKALNMAGEFWQSESFDHLVRDLEHFRKFQKYIANNPKKANLLEGQYLHYQFES